MGGGGWRYLNRFEIVTFVVDPFYFTCSIQFTFEVVIFKLMLILPLLLFFNVLLVRLFFLSYFLFIPYHPLEIATVHIFMAFMCV